MSYLIIVVKSSYRFSIHFIMSHSVVVQNLRHRAAANAARRFILLPEFSDPRVLCAARKVTDSHIAKIGIPGKRDDILRAADHHQVDLRGVSIIDTTRDDVVDIAARRLIERRKGKEDLSMEEARNRVSGNSLDLSNLLVSSDAADGMVAGSLATSAEVARSAIKCMGLGKNNKTASSFFVMSKENKWKILADCGFIVDPTVEQLACIAGTTARSTRALLGVDPMVAMLSFSTRGSANHPNVDKMREATKLAKETYPEFTIDGEIQGDAALVPEVSFKKSPDSPLKGTANVLIFPDLQAGNIAYKLLERLGGWEAIGPIMQGFYRPTNDLSRGCSDEDIVSTVAITVLQSNETAVLRSSDIGDIIP
jgi:phosphate acetyltransferase